MVGQEPPIGHEKNYSNRFLVVADYISGSLAWLLQNPVAHERWKPQLSPTDLPRRSLLISARELERWVECNRTRLATLGVVVSFGRTMRIGRRPGPTWASFASRASEGRVIRTPDGCFQFDANRFVDGAVLQHELRTTASFEDIDAFVLLLTSKEPGDRLATG